MPNALLILVPRHPERFQGVKALTAKLGFEFVSRTDKKPCSTQTQVFIGDTMGELSLFYKASDVAFVGGSLVPIGGHNTLEAAIVGLPIVVGEHTHNFVEITRMLSEVGALVKINGSKMLAHVVGHWLKTPQERKLVGEQGLEVVVKNQGALKKTLGLILQYYQQ